MTVKGVTSGVIVTENCKGLAIWVTTHKVFFKLILLGNGSYKLIRTSKVLLLIALLRATH